MTFTATVSATNAVPNGTITFYNGSVSLGTGTLDTSGIATLTTTFPTAGTFPITAVYPATELRLAAPRRPSQRPS